MNILSWFLVLEVARTNTSVLPGLCLNPTKKSVDPSLGDLRGIVSIKKKVLAW